MADDDNRASDDVTSKAPNPGQGDPPGRSAPDGVTPKGDEKGGKPNTPKGDEGAVAALEQERQLRREAERNAAQYRDRVTELEDAGKSELERATAQLKRASDTSDQHSKRIAELEAELNRRDLDSLKRDIAAEYELPPSVAKRLQGKDKRELAADARALKEELQAGRPTGSLGIGHGGSATGARRNADMNSLIRRAAGRE